MPAHLFLMIFLTIALRSLALFSFYVLVSYLRIDGFMV
jgi:hypothetical protein